MHRSQRFISLLLLVCLSLACSGCAPLSQWWRNGLKVGPNYLRPAAPVADAWIDFNDPRVISDRYGADDFAWWTAFRDPAIDQLVQTSATQNLSLRAAGLRVLAAQYQRAAAVGSLFPQFQEAFGEYQRVQVSRNGAPGGPGFIPIKRAFDFWTTGFNVAWEVDVWGRFRRSIESADATLDVSVEDYDDILVCLIAETAAAYVDIRAFEQRIAYAQGNVAAQRGSLEIAESRFRNGAVSELDVTQAQSIVGETEALIPVLETGRRQAQNRLCVLLGIPPRDLAPELGPGPIPAPPADVVVGIPADLLRRRPDVRRAEREVAAQSALIGVAASDLFPVFTINGSLNWQASRFSNLLNSGSLGGFVGPAFNWNILNYGRIINNVRTQDALFQSLAVEYQQTVLTANSEVEDAIVGFLNAQQQVLALDKSVRATQRSVEIALIQYREGAIDYNRVFNLQSSLVTLQDQLATAQADVALNLIFVYKALGGGWQIRCAPYLPLAPEELPLEAPPVEEAPVPPAQPILHGVALLPKDPPR